MSDLVFEDMNSESISTWGRFVGITQYLVSELQFLT